MTIGESFVFNGSRVTVMGIERNEAGSIVLVSLRHSPRLVVYYFGESITDILDARAASLPARLS